MFNDSKDKDFLEIVKKHGESHAQMIKELGRIGSNIARIEDFFKSLNKVNEQLITLQTYPQPYRADGFLYNSLFVSDAAVTDNAKLVVIKDGIQYSTTLIAGENEIDMPDDSTFYVTTTSGKPVSALLTRYNALR